MKMWSKQVWECSVTLDGLSIQEIKSRYYTAYLSTFLCRRYLQWKFMLTFMSPTIKYEYVLPLSVE